MIEPLHLKKVLLVALLFLSCPVRASGSLVVLMPTKDGLIVAADTRSVLVSASLGVDKACDGESKLVELAMVERTVVAFVGSRRLFFPMSVFSAQDPCGEIKRVPVGSVGLDVVSVVRQYLDQDGIVIDKSRLNSFTEQFLAKVNSLDLSPLVKTFAGKSLFGISVGSYDVRASKSLIGSFSINLTTQPLAAVRNFNWEEVDQGEVRGAIPKGEVDYLMRQVVRGPGKKYLKFDFSKRPVSSISAKEGMAFAVNVIEATIKTMETLKDSNRVGGKIEVVLVGTAGKPIRLK
jgi:hypothetical protein